MGRLGDFFPHVAFPLAQLPWSICPSVSVTTGCTELFRGKLHRTHNFTTGAGTYNATLTATVTNGVITAVAITAAGSAMTNGTYTSAANQVKITDPTGIGAQSSVTIASGAVSAVTRCDCQRRHCRAQSIQPR